MSTYDLIIRGGTIVDGLRTPRYVGDIAVKDGVIAKVDGLKNSDAKETLEASGLIVAPGFVDLHTHYDAQIQWDPYCSLSGWHGVTSVVIGNCGFGFAPAREQDRDRLMLALTRNEAIPYEAMKLGMTWDWTTFDQFLTTLERIPKAVNLITYAPLSPIYAWVMGYDEAKKRRPTGEELDQMVLLLDEALDAGACGWSAQVFGPDSNQRDYDGTPMITDLMTPRELLAFAKVLAVRDEGSIELSYIDQVDSGAGVLNEATRGLLEQVAETARRPVLYQAVSPIDSDPEHHQRILQWLSSCADKGLRVFGQGATQDQTQTLTFEHWNRFDVSPTWRQVTLGSPEERMNKMNDPQNRAALRAEWDAGIRPSITVGSISGLLVQSVVRDDFEKYIGKTVELIAETEGKHVIDALLDIAVGDRLKTEFFGRDRRGNAQFAADVMLSPYVVAGVSDGGAHVKFNTGASYPTDLLTWLVRDKGLLSLEDAHFKLSYLPAHASGFRDRGFIRAGSPADIVVYDLENLALGPIEVAHDLPGGDWRRVQKAVGYRWIVVNGQITMINGEPTGNLSGRLLRHGRG